MLESVLTGKGHVMFSKHVLGNGKQLFELAQQQDLEGIMAKRLDSEYSGRRSRDWLKIKTGKRQECVIGGWTEGRGSRKHFGALLVGVYEKDEFVYVGSVGTGFDEKKLEALAKRFAPLERKTAAFVNPPKPDTKAHWIKPELVAEIAFNEWTRDGVMRQPVFIALREDKEPKDVVREIPKHTEDVA